MFSNRDPSSVLSRHTLSIHFSVVLLFALLISPLVHAGNPGKDLIKAAKKGKTAKVEATLAKGADVDFRNKNAKTALIVAAERGHSGTVRALLAHGADLDAKTQSGLTALMVAAWGTKETRGQAEMDNMSSLRHVLTFPAPNPKARQAQTETIEALLAKGADVGAKAENGRDALALAAYRGSTDAVKTLLAAGADVNAKRNDGRTPLIESVEHCYTDTAELLLASGADVNAATNDGATALMEAAGHSCIDTVEVLIANGADVKATTGKGLTALMYAAYSPYKGDIEVLEKLLAAGADSTAKTTDGRTAKSFAEHWKDRPAPRASSSPRATSGLAAQFQLQSSLRALAQLKQMQRFEKHKKELVQILAEAGAKE